jgi:hypothetical protein
MSDPIIETARQDLDALLAKLSVVSRALTQFLDKHPSDCEALFSLAVIRLHQISDATAWEAARALFERVVEIDPRHSNAVYYLGLIAEHSPDVASKAGAQAYFERALSINSKHGAALAALMRMRNSAAAESEVRQSAREPTVSASMDSNGGSVGSIATPRDRLGVYWRLRDDPTRDSADAVALIDLLKMEGRPRPSYYRLSRLIAYGVPVIFLVLYGLGVALG